MTKVALLGTCNDTTWRDKLIPLLTVEFFDPVIKDRKWSEEDRQNEILQTQNCELVVFAFTPRMTGLFSIAEAIDCSNKRPRSTVIFLQESDISDEGKRIVFTPSVQASMDAIINLAKANGAKICYDLESVAQFVNN